MFQFHRFIFVLLFVCMDAFVSILVLHHEWTWLLVAWDFGETSQQWIAMAWGNRGPVWNMTRGTTLHWIHPNKRYLRNLKKTQPGVFFGFHRFYWNPKPFGLLQLRWGVTSVFFFGSSRAPAGRCTGVWRIVTGKAAMCSTWTSRGDHPDPSSSFQPNVKLVQAETLLCPSSIPCNTTVGALHEQTHPCIHKLSFEHGLLRRNSIGILQ